MSKNSIMNWVNMYCGGHWVDSLEFANLCVRRMNGHVGPDRPQRAAVTKSVDA